MFMMLLKIVSLCLLVGVHHVCANERPMPGLSFRDVDLIRTISQDTMQLEASNATDIGSSETFASSLVENYSFSAYQILRGIDYDTYMTNSKINNVVLQKSIVNGLNSLLKMFPVENLVLSPDDIAIYDVRSTFVYTSQSQTEEAAGNNVLISYFVNCKIPSDIYVSPDALYSALKASINTYRADESVSGLTSILQATAEIYGAVNLTTVISSSVGYPLEFKVKYGTPESSPSSSMNEPTFLEGIRHPLGDQILLILMLLVGTCTTVIFCVVVLYPSARVDSTSTKAIQIGIEPFIACGEELL